MRGEDVREEARRIISELRADPFGQLSEAAYEAAFVNPMHHLAMQLRAWPVDCGMTRMEFDHRWMEWQLWCRGDLTAWQSDFEGTTHQMYRGQNVRGMWGWRRVAHLRHLLTNPHQVMEPHLSAGVLMPITWCFEQRVVIDLSEQEFFEAKVTFAEIILERCRREANE